MLTSLSNYVYDRRRGLVKTAGVVGGAYVVGRYVLDRLQDVRERVVQERSARETIRKRFSQNMQDSTFTIMAHMPLLGANILTGMDVEALTAELQALTKSKKAALQSQPHPTLITSTNSNPRPPTVTAKPNTKSETESGSESEAAPESSAELAKHRDEEGSENGSVSVISANEGMTESTTSWVQPSESGSEGQQQQQEESSQPQSLSASVGNLADSFTSTSSESGLSTSAADLSSSQTRSKAELWREVKMLAITRTLTVLYTTTLLTLFTHLQLSLLGRYKYVQAIQAQARAEAAREQRPFDESLEALFFAPPGSDLESGIKGKGMEVWDEDAEEDEIWRHGVGEETERRYLMLSWWLLNCGWREVGERVRGAVEEVFEGVSLKGRLGAIELHRLVCEVRRRVEYEVTYEGTERQVTFINALLPQPSTSTSTPSPPTSLSPSTSTSPPPQPRLSTSPNPFDDADMPHDPAYNALLEETRDRLASADYARVFERALDRGTEVLFMGLEKNVFAPEVLDGAADVDSVGARVRLAALLPALARWSAVALNGLPNELVDNLADVREVEAWAAIVYTGYEDRFPCR